MCVSLQFALAPLSRNQVLAQVDLWENVRDVDVYRLSKELDEEVAAKHPYEGPIFIEVEDRPIFP